MLEKQTIALIAILIDFEIARFDQNERKYCSIKTWKSILSNGASSIISIMCTYCSKWGISATCAIVGNINNNIHVEETN